MNPICLSKYLIEFFQTKDQLLQDVDPANELTVIWVEQVYSALARIVASGQYQLLISESQLEQIVLNDLEEEQSEDFILMHGVAAALDYDAVYSKWRDEFGALGFGVVPQLPADAKPLEFDDLFFLAYVLLLERLFQMVPTVALAGVVESQPISLTPGIQPSMGGSSIGNVAFGVAIVVLILALDAARTAEDGPLSSGPQIFSTDTSAATDASSDADASNSVDSTTAGTGALGNTATDDRQSANFQSSKSQASSTKATVAGKSAKGSSGRAVGAASEVLSESIERAAGRVALARLNLTLGAASIVFAPNDPADAGLNSPNNGNHVDRQASAIAGLNRGATSDVADVDGARSPIGKLFQAISNKAHGLPSVSIKGLLQGIPNFLFGEQTIAAPLQVVSLPANRSIGDAAGSIASDVFGPTISELNGQSAPERNGQPNYSLSLPNSAGTNTSGRNTPGRNNTPGTFTPQVGGQPNSPSLPNTPGTNSAGTNTPGTNTSGTNSAGTNTSGTSAPQVGGQPNSPSLPNTPGTNSAGTNTSGTNTPGTNTPGTSGPQVGGQPNSPSLPNTPGTNSAGTNTPGTNTSGTNTSGTNTSGTNTPETSGLQVGGQPNSPSLPNTPGTNSAGTNTSGTSTPGTSGPQVGGQPNSPSLPNTPGTNSAGTSTSGTNTPGTSTPGTSTPGTNTSGTNTPGTNTPGTSGPQVGGQPNSPSLPNTPGTNSAGTNTSGTNSAGTNTSGTNTSGTNTSGTSTPGTSGPQVSGQPNSPSLPNTPGTNSAGTNTSGTNTSGTNTPETSGLQVGGQPNSPSLPNTPGTNSAGTNTSGTNTSGTNTSGTNTSGTNTSGTNTSGTNTSGTNTSGTNTPGTNTSGTNTSGTSGPQVGGQPNSPSLPNNPGTNTPGGNNHGSPLQPPTTIDPGQNQSLPTQSFFNEGTLTVGVTGKVTIDFLVDCGFYKGELGLFNTAGMEQLVTDPMAFTEEALRRTQSRSALGTVIISDTIEGAKYHGVLSGEAADWNQGEYQGPKTFSLTPGAQYGWILIPNGTFQESDRQINLASDRGPIFSMFQPENGNLFGQRLVAKVDSNTIAIEDIHSEFSDRDYNDLVVRLDGASLNATTIRDVINLDHDWTRDGTIPSNGTTKNASWTPPMLGDKQSSVTGALTCDNQPLHRDWDQLR